MYESFYGLKEKPFSLLPDPAYLYLSKQHEMAMTLLEYSLENQAGFCVVSGKAGTGKTTLLRRLLNRIGDDVSVGLITNTHHSFGELLRWILNAFNLEEGGKSRAELHQIFVDYLIRQYAKNQRTMLIIDEAQNMSSDALEELRMLSNINSEKDLLLQVILVGQPALREILRRPELEQFAQRIAVDYHLDSLGRDETRAYIRHRIVVAGGESELFSEDACDAVFEYSSGIPRLINLLCDFALVYAYAGQAAVVTGELVDQVVNEREAYGALPVFVHGSNRVAKSLSGGGVSAASVAQTVHRHAGSRSNADIGSVIAMDAHTKTASVAFEVAAKGDGQMGKTSPVKRVPQATLVHGQGMASATHPGSARDASTASTEKQKTPLDSPPGAQTDASATQPLVTEPERQPKMSGVATQDAVTVGGSTAVVEAEDSRRGRPDEAAQGSAEQRARTEKPPRDVSDTVEVIPPVNSRPGKEQANTPPGFVPRSRAARAASVTKRYVPVAAIVMLFLGAPLVWRAANHRFEWMSPASSAAPRPPIMAATAMPPAKLVVPETPANVPVAVESASPASATQLPPQAPRVKPAVARNDPLQAEKMKLIERERAAALAIAKAAQRERDAERAAALARERALAAEHEAALAQERERANQRALAAEKARQEARAAAAVAVAQEKKPESVKPPAAAVAQDKIPVSVKSPAEAVPAGKLASAPAVNPKLPQKNTEANAGVDADPEAGARESTVFTANPCKGPSARFLSTCE